MKQLICLLLLTWSLKYGIAQDPHFTQYFASPLTLNPASSGKGFGSLRATLNNRKQWAEIGIPYFTSTASIDGRIFNEKIDENDIVGIGVLMLNDRTGNNGLKSNYIGTSLSYHKSLDEESSTHLGIGLQLGFMSKSLDFNKLVFGNQLTKFGYDLSLPNNEINTTPTLNYSDLNIGVLYSNYKSEQNMFYIGVSMYHFNKPKESFQSKDLPIATRYTVNGGGFIELSNSTRLHFSGLYTQQAKSRQINLGSAIALNVNNDWYNNPTTLFAGVWVKPNVAISPYFSLEFQNLQFGFSYDINGNKINTFNSKKGGGEISLIYNHIRPNKQKGIPCPKF